MRGYIYIILVSMSLFGCDNSQNPPAILETRRQFLIDNEKTIDELASDFKLSPWIKMSWSDTGFITLLNTDQDYLEGYSVEALSGSSGLNLNEDEKKRLRTLLQKADGLGIDCLRISFGVCLEFTDRTVLWISDGQEQAILPGSFKGKKILPVRAGWILFLDL